MQIWKNENIKAHKFIPKKYWENNYNYVDYIISNAEKLPVKPQFYFYQSVISFYKHLTNYHFNGNQEDIDACRAIIKNMKLTGMKSYGTELEEFLNDHI